jgi:hypothetical protein
LQQLAGLAKLFIAGEETPELARMTKELYREAPGPKELASLRRTNLGLLSEEERREYENLVISFFLRHLPLSPSR